MLATGMPRSQLLRDAGVRSHWRALGIRVPRLLAEHEP